MAREEFVQVEIAVLGGGPAGYVAAIRAAQLGAAVALIEEQEVGGTCLNRGCIPTKALLKTSETVGLIKKSKEFGVEATLSSVNWLTAVNRKERIVKNLRLGLEHLLKKNGVQIIRGKGKIQSVNQLSVETKSGEVTVHCSKLILTTGSEPAKPDIPGIHLDRVITSDEALELQEVPQNLVIIGAGAIGLEFATMFNAAGSKVTVVEYQENILPQEDKEITSELLKMMKRQGVTFKLSARLTEINEGPDGLEVVIEEKGKVASLKGDTVLVAVGRKSKNPSPVLRTLGIQIEKGAIVVNEHMETSMKGVYAAGDAVGGRLLAHLAFAEGRVAAENALGIPSKLNYDAVPSCVYTSPEIASVGLNEAEARARGLQVKVGKFNFRNNGRALCLGEREGFVKVVVEKDSHVLLGAQILGPQATEMISEMTLAVMQRVSAEVIADMIHPHPTLGEAIMEACGDALGRAVHKG